MNTKNISYFIRKKSFLKVYWCNFNYRTLSLKSDVKENMKTNFSHSAEVNYAESILIDFEIFPKSSIMPSLMKQDVKISEVNDIINQRWTDKNSAEALKSFEIVSWYTYNNPMMISNFCYRNVLDKLLSNNLKYFNNYQLYCFIKSLELVKNSINLNSRYFFKSIEKICINKLKNMSVDHILLINYYFYRLGIIQNSTFAYDSVIKLKPIDLNHKNLLRYVFLLRIHVKNIPTNLSDIEQYCIRNTDKMNINELAIVLLSFYKYRYIINNDLTIKLVESIKTNIDEIDSILLTTIIKILKMSIRPSNSKYMYTLIQFLEYRVSSFNVYTLTHMAHLQARSFIRNNTIISEIVKRAENGFKDWRIKDIERIILTLFQLNYNPEETPFYSKAVNEVTSLNRKEEIQKYRLSFLYLAQFLCQANYFDERILNIIMKPNFAYNLPIDKLEYEYFIIEKCLELDHPEKFIPKLDKSFFHMFNMKAQAISQQKNKLYKRENILNEISYYLKILLKSDENIYSDLILPHILNNNIIICYDNKNKRFLSPKTKLSKIPRGKIKYAPKDDNTWYVLLLATQSNSLQYTFEPSGYLSMHLRHLMRAGYTPILIPSNKWRNSNKLLYLKSLLNQ